ncbi:DUF4230 domain-containing protein [Arthrobacter sp. TmT3-37]
MDRAGTTLRRFGSSKGTDIIKLLKRAALTVTCATVLVLAGIGVGNIYGFGLFQTERIDRSQPTLLTSIEDIGEYHAAMGNFEVLLDVEDDVAWLPDFVAGRRTLFVAAGTVDAYVDLSGLTERDIVVSDDGDSVKMRVPEPQLDKPNLDQSRSYLFAQDRGVFERVADAIELPEQSQFYQDAESRMVSAAEESELRQQAADNTRAMLTGLCGSLGIRVSFID